MSLLEPGVLQAVISGEAQVKGLGIKIGPEALLIYAVIMLIPPPTVTYNTL